MIFPNLKVKPNCSGFSPATPVKTALQSLQFRLNFTHHTKNCCITPAAKKRLLVSNFVSHIPCSEAPGYCH